MGPLARGLSSVIGLGTEAYAARKRSRSPSPANGRVTAEGYAHQPSQSTLAPPAYDESHRRASSDGEDDYDEDDDDVWVRQETQEQLMAPDSSYAQGDETIEAILARFEAAHPPPSYMQSVAQLPMPVVIPQKRPQSKTRGWVRAYSPVLNDVGIDQGTFLDFIDGFDKAIKLSPYFHALNLAVAGVVLGTTIAGGPLLAVHLAALAVHTSIEAGRRVYNSAATNKYLDVMNEKLFRPHGVYAMIMTYKPDASGDLDATIDMNANIFSAVNTRSNPSGSRFTNLHSSSGYTVGDQMIPECAPLVFPTLDAATDEEKKNAFKRAGGFATDYFDRRSQAKFANDNPNSKLNVAATPEFASRFSDPNHPVNSKDATLLTVLSGGKIPGLKQRLRSRTGRDSSAQRSSPISAIKKKLKENVLYLMIVNMPTEAEMREAAAMVEAARRY